MNKQRALGNAFHGGCLKSRTKQATRLCCPFKNPNYTYNLSITIMSFVTSLRTKLSKN